jgi:phosphoribosyl-AMP cyclohydrolase
MLENNLQRYPQASSYTATSSRQDAFLVESTMHENWLEEIKWNEQGLIPAVVQDAEEGGVLMVAWMNRESLTLSVQEGRAIYWSRSRHRLWRKGEESGHWQEIQEIRLDCDSDVLLLVVHQRGGIACHTGRRSCFYRRLQERRWVAVEPVIKDPRTIYAASSAKRP